MFTEYLLFFGTSSSSLHTLISATFSSSESLTQFVHTQCSTVILHIATMIQKCSHTFHWCTVGNVIIAIYHCCDVDVIVTILLTSQRQIADLEATVLMKDAEMSELKQRLLPNGSVTSTTRAHGTVLLVMSYSSPVHVVFLQIRI